MFGVSVIFSSGHAMHKKAIRSDPFFVKQIFNSRITASECSTIIVTFSWAAAGITTSTCWYFFLKMPLIKKIRCYSNWNQNSKSACTLWITCTCSSTLYCITCVCMCVYVYTYVSKHVSCGGTQCVTLKIFTLTRTTCKHLVLCTVGQILNVHLISRCQVKECCFYDEVVSDLSI